MTGRYLAFGCLFLLTTVGPCYYYYTETYPEAKKAEATDDLTSSPRCKLSFPHNLTFEKSESWIWKQVDSQFKWYVNSAYLDRRLSVPLIRIIAMSKEPTKRTLYCQMWSNEKLFTVVEAQQQELWIHAWDLAKPGEYYHPFLLSCPVPSGREYPSAVSISVDNPCSSPTNWLDVGKIHRKKQKGFVVCLKPVNFESDISSRLVEWFELQLLLGADNIFVYVKRVHPKTRRVLEYYEKSGRLMMVNHTVPGTDITGLWQKRRHEIAVYNDCLYRHLETHQFVVNLDLDEAIIPVIRDSWHQLLVNHSSSASISVRCVYFFDSLGEENSIPQHLHMMRHVYRSSNFTPPGFALKSFFATSYAEAVSNHFALRAVHSNVRLLSGLSVQEARLHHYRKECPPKMENECDENFMKFWQRDTLIWKYKKKLEKNVNQTMNELYT